MSLKIKNKLKEFRLKNHKSIQNTKFGLKIKLSNFQLVWMTLDLSPIFKLYTDKKWARRMCSWAFLELILHQITATKYCIKYNYQILLSKTFKLTWTKNKWCCRRKNITYVSISNIKLTIKRQKLSLCPIREFWNWLYL